MIKLFGEFLVDHHIITEAELAQALVAQVEMLPSTVEVIHRNQLLSDKRIIEIFKCHQATGRDFRSAARFLGFWSKDLEMSITKHLEAARTPLGEVLVSLKILSHDALSKALDQYVRKSNSMDRDALDSIISLLGRELSLALSPAMHNLLLQLKTQENLTPFIEEISKCVKKITIIASPIRDDRLKDFLKDLNLFFSYIAQQQNSITPHLIQSYISNCLKIFPLIPHFLNPNAESEISILFSEIYSNLKSIQTHVSINVSKTVA